MATRTHGRPPFHRSYTTNSTSAAARSNTTPDQTSSRYSGANAHTTYCTPKAGDSSRKPARASATAPTTSSGWRQTRTAGSSAQIATTTRAPGCTRADATVDAPAMSAKWTNPHGRVSTPT